MVKRFLIALGLVLLYMAVWAGILYLAILIAQDNEGALLVLILVAFALILLLFIPYLDQVAKRVFAFPGEGEPIPIAELRDLIGSVNGFVNAPVIVQERAYKLTGQRALVVTWKYVDARWWEALSRADISRLESLSPKLLQHTKSMIGWLTSATLTGGENHGPQPAPPSAPRCHPEQSEGSSSDSRRQRPHPYSPPSLIPP